MMSDIDKYKIALLEFYKAQRDSDKLTPELENPNRTRLKEEFLRLYRVKHEKTDTELIRRFFDPEGKYEDQLDSIAKIELDKLRPLVGFMINGTMLRDDPPVHALAWLLKFPPYTQWKRTDKPEDTPGEKPDTGGTKEPEITPSGPPLQKYIFGSIILLLIGSAICWNYPIISKFDPPSPTEKCMYWDGNRYVPAECDKTSAGRTTIPLDNRVLKNFKKVRWPDLLTKKDIGKVWYVRIDGDHEFFTDSATYPTDPQKRLKPLSAFILSNHVSYYRFLLKSLIWCVAIVVLLVILNIGIKKALRKQTFRIHKLSSPTEFTQDPLDLHSSS
jgi:hypothetical protein